MLVPRWNELDALLDEVRRLYKEDRILKVRRYLSA